MIVKINKVDFVWLNNYCNNVCNILDIHSAVFWERYALTEIKQYDAVSNIWKITSNEIDVGFAITPSFAPHILNSIYIYPRYRREGIAELIINQLQITNLSCIAINTDALRLYKRLGFVITDLNPQKENAFSLERKI